MRFFNFRVNVIILLSCFLFGFSSLASAEFVKVSNNGKALPASAALGSGPNDWSCTYDSTTQLIWEVKTADNGLRDRKWTYSWYNSHSADGNNGVANLGTCKTAGRCDTEKYTQDVNGQSLCGSKDWHLPTVDELKTLVLCPNGQNNREPFDCVATTAGNNTALKIESNYFPNTQSDWYWTSTIFVNNTKSAWYVNFLSGGRDNNNRSSIDAVRLVRSGQSFNPSNLPPVVVNVPPVADFTATPSDGVKPLKVTLNASASSDAEGAIATYDWASSDGQKTTGKISTLNFTTAGTFTITLTVIDKAGATSKKSSTIVVKSEPNKPPVAAFSATPGNGKAPLAVNLDASAASDSDGSISSYSWTSSDGQNASGKTANLSFSKVGQFTITLTVTDDLGAKTTLSKDVSVNPETQSFFKISNSGNILPDSAQLGAGQDDWACTYDSRTNLIWEVKTKDQDLRSNDWFYTWFDSNSPAGNKGAAGDESNCKTPGRCDTEKFVQDVNAQGLCGTKDWRVPSSDELRSLVYCSSNQPQAWNKQATFCQGDFKQPTIDESFFPFTQSGSYSSATVHTLKPDNVWVVNFASGTGAYSLKSQSNALRLVRSGQIFDYLNNPLALYDEKTEVLTLDSVSIGGNILYLELQNIGNYRFKVKESRQLANVGQATIADFNADTFILDIKLVLAYNKTFKIQMKLDALGVYSISKFTLM